MKVQMRKPWRFGRKPTRTTCSSRSPTPSPQRCFSRHVSLFLPCYPILRELKQKQEFTNDPARAQKWTGLRQDSGNPFEFAPAAKAMYESIGIDTRTKTIVYSDSLTSDKVLQLKKQCDDIGFRCEWVLVQNYPMVVMSSFRFFWNWNIPYE